MQIAKGIVSLLKLRTVALLVVVALVSAMVASRGMSWDIPTLAILVVAGALACAGSGALNHYFDRDIDSLQVRTRRRPLPSGRVRPGVAAFLGLAMILASLGISLHLNRLVTLFIGMGIFTYVIVYTCWLKRRTPQNIVIGGLAGSWAVLAGWFTFSREIALLPVLLALVVFLWTPVHFWSFALAHVSDYRRSGLPMLPAVVGEREAARHIFMYAILSLIASGAIIFWTGFSLISVVSWLLLAGVFCFSNLRLFIGTAAEHSRSNFKLSGLYLLGLFLIVGLDLALR